MTVLHSLNIFCKMPQVLFSSLVSAFVTRDRMGIARVACYLRKLPNLRRDKDSIFHWRIFRVPSTDATKRFSDGNGRECFQTMENSQETDLIAKYLRKCGIKGSYSSSLTVRMTVNLFVLIGLWSKPILFSCCVFCGDFWQII